VEAAGAIFAFATAAGFLYSGSQAEMGMGQPPAPNSGSRFLIYPTPAKPLAHSYCAILSLPRSIGG